MLYVSMIVVLALVIAAVAIGLAVWWTSGVNSVRRMKPGFERAWLIAFMVGAGVFQFGLLVLTLWFALR